MLPVFERQSWVYSVLIFCSSASRAAVLLAKEMKVACCACKVVEMAIMNDQGDVTREGEGD